MINIYQLLSIIEDRFDECFSADYVEKNKFKLQLYSMVNF